MNRSGDYRYVLPAEFAWLARNASNLATAGGALAALCERHIQGFQRTTALAPKLEPDAALYSDNLNGGYGAIMTRPATCERPCHITGPILYVAGSSWDPHKPADAEAGRRLWAQAGPPVIR